MSALTDQTEADLLDLMFTNVAAPNWGVAGGLQPSTTAGSLFMSLHTGDAIGDTTTGQNTSETTYSGYSRQGAARSTAGWTVSGTNPTKAANDTLLQFGSMTAGGPVTITDVGIGYASTGVGYLHFWGQVTSDLVVNNGVNPQFAIAALEIQIN